MITSGGKVHYNSTYLRYLVKNYSKGRDGAGANERDMGRRRCWRDLVMYDYLQLIFLDYESNGGWARLHGEVSDHH